MNKYIFLDFDGVLNSWRSDIANHGVQSNPEQMIEAFNVIDPKFDPIAVHLVRRLVEETRAKIVVSSSWRKLNTIEGLVKSFTYYGWDAPIIGMTPNLRVQRGYEIEDWLKTNAQPEDKYVILDDGTDMLASQGINFVNTDPRNGFSYDDFHQALKILNG